MIRAATVRESVTAHLPKRFQNTRTMTHYHWNDDWAIAVSPYPPLPYGRGSD